jgi:aspartate aminotransferase-like enzyme
LNTLGLTPFAKEDARSNVIIALNYLDGMDDKKFRTLLSKEFKVLIAGGFGNLKGKVFRIGSMGEVTRYHVMRTISSIYAAIKMLGIDANEKALSVAEEKLKNL